MKRLADSLNKVLDDLSAQQADDYPSMETRYQVIGNETQSRTEPPDARNAPAVRRIAFLTDGHEPDTALQFAIDTCRCQSASLDIVQYGPDTEVIDTRHASAQSAGIGIEAIRLAVDELNTLNDYLNTRRGLLYLIAANDDELARKFSARMQAQHGESIPVPMVMIDRY